MADERTEDTQAQLPSGNGKPSTNGNGAGPSHYTESADDPDGKFHKPGHAKMDSQKKEQADHAVEEQKAEEKKEEKKSITRNPIFLIVAAIVVFALLIWGWNAFRYSQTHVGTDDAYVSGDLINVSPIISGTLETLTVDEG